MDMDSVFDARYPSNRALPVPLIDDVQALAGLIQARMSLRTALTGEPFTYGEARALAECLLARRWVSYERLQEALGCEFAQLYGIAQYLARVGLLADNGEHVGLVHRPVEIEVFVGSDENWRLVTPGTAPRLAAGERVRIAASSHLGLDMRVFRVFHRAAGGTSIRSISMKSMSRRRPAVIELEIDGDSDEEPGVEQILVHVAWPAMSLGDWDLYEPPVTGPPRTLAESVERERRELCHSAGMGWVAEYLFPSLV